MAFLEPILIAVIAALSGAAAAYVSKNQAANAFLKYGEIVKKAYNIIDPVLDQNLHNWKGSQVDRAFELAIETVADGKLSAQEIKKLAFFMAKEWLPQKAADKVRELEAASQVPPELTIAAQIASKVNAAK
jgi:hypothetical protein